MEKFSVKSVISPEISFDYFMYRLPFYINMVSVGYYFYYFFTTGFDAADDKSGRMTLAFTFGLFSYLLALAYTRSTFWKHKKPDYIGIGYLILVLIISMIAFFFLVLPELQFGPTV